MNILCVDDEEFILEWYQELMEQAFPGSRIFLAADGCEALEHCEKTRFSLVLTDFRMPRMDGALFVGKLRNGPTVNAHVPIVVISGYLPQEMSQLFAFPDIHTMHKPVNVEVLMNLCNRLTRFQGSA